MDIRELKIKDLRNLMGIVSQQPILFNTTFKENIAFAVDAPCYVTRLKMQHILPMPMISSWKLNWGMRIWWENQVTS